MKKVIMVFMVLAGAVLACNLPSGATRFIDLTPVAPGRSSIEATMDSLTISPTSGNGIFTVNVSGTRGDTEVFISCDAINENNNSVDSRFYNIDQMGLDDYSYQLSFQTAELIVPGNYIYKCSLQGRDRTTSFTVTAPPTIDNSANSSDNPSANPNDQPTSEIAWGDNTSTWSVNVANGKVVSGQANGGVWIATGGTFDGTNLYVVWVEVGHEDKCDAHVEHWLTVEPTRVIWVKSSNQCGTVRTPGTAYNRTK